MSTDAEIAAAHRAYDNMRAAWIADRDRRAAEAETAKDSTPTIVNNGSVTIHGSVVYGDQIGHTGGTVHGDIIMGRDNRR